MSFSKDDEDDDFAPTARSGCAIPSPLFSHPNFRSKLSNLFSASSQAGDDSLSYTRPKEQVKEKAPAASAPSAAMSVQSASAVHSYKLFVISDVSSFLASTEIINLKESSESPFLETGKRCLISMSRFSSILVQDFVVWTQQTNSFYCHHFKCLCVHTRCKQLRFFLRRFSRQLVWSR